MALTSLNELRELEQADQESLLDIAHASIALGLKTGRCPDIDLQDVPPELRRLQASFVTLKNRECLRGCVGSIRPTRPLAQDVCRNAFAAAFQNVRFPKVRADEFPSISISISLLSPERPVAAGSLAEAIAAIRPGKDGVILRRGRQVATFLPQVWETLQDPAEFLRHLRYKAGLDPDAWSSDIHVSTYTVQPIARYPDSRRIHSTH